MRLFFSSRRRHTRFDCDWSSDVCSSDLQVLLNVNVPEPWNGSVQFTRQSKKITRNQLSEGKDPRGRSYFWLFEQRIERDVEPDTDYAAIFSSAVSITPLHLDPTHTESLNHLSHWAKTIAAAFPKQR